MRLDVNRILLLDPAEANEASTFLIVGGLIVLGVVLVLVVIRSVLPMAPPERGDRRKGALGRELRRSPDLEADVVAGQAGPLLPDDVENGRKAAKHFGPRTVEEALDHAVRSGWSEPRILQLDEERLIVRNYRCDECQGGPKAVAEAAGCGFNAGYLVGAVERLSGRGVRVSETACRRRGAPVCEFELLTPPKRSLAPARNRRHARATTVALILLGIVLAQLVEAFVWAGAESGRSPAEAIEHVGATFEDPDLLAILRFAAGALAGFLASGLMLQHVGAINLARMLGTALLLMVAAAVGGLIGLATYVGLAVAHFADTTWSSVARDIPSALGAGNVTVWGLLLSGAILGAIVTALALGTEAVRRIGRGAAGLFLGGIAGLTIYGLAYLAVHYPGVPDSPYYFLHVGEAIYSFSTLEFFFVGLGALVGLLIARNSWRFYGVVTFVSMIAVILGFLGYSFWVTLPAVEAPWHFLAALLFVAETVTLVMVVLYAFYTIDVSARKRWRKVPEDATYSKYYLPRVAFQVCVFNEPTDLVVETLRRLLRMDYPQDRFLIMVLDDSTREELLTPLQEFCKAHGIQHLHRADRRGYKAGALNDSLDHVPKDVELIAVVDADYQIEPEFLKETVGYFANPNLGWLQTPQDYRNRGQSFLTEQYYLADAYFYRTVMPSRNEENTIIFCGTMGIVRRPALLEVGRWGEKYISEDAELSIRLLTHGWESLYVNKTYGRGLIPATFEAYKKQHYRWAFGGAKILRGHFWDIVLGRLSPRQSFDYFVGSAHWFEGLFIVFIAGIIAALALSELLGLTFVTHHSREILLIGLIPFFLLTDGFTRLHMVMRDRNDLSFGRTLRVLGMWMSVKFSNSFGALKSFVGFNMPFVRTRKAPQQRISRNEALFQAFRVSPFESAMGLGLFALLMAILVKLWLFYGGLNVPAPRLFLAFWLLYYSLVFLSAPFYAYKAFVTFTPDEPASAAAAIGRPRPAA